MDHFFPRGERVRILYDSKLAARVTLGVAHTRRNTFAWLANVMTQFRKT